MATLAPMNESPRVTAPYRIDVSRGRMSSRVSSEWFSRPDDEKYLSLTSLYDAVRGRADRATTRDSDTLQARGRALHACLSQFSLAHRELLLAPHDSKVTIAELASRSNKSPNAFYKLLARLRDQLTDCMRQRLAAEAPNA